MKCPKHNIEIDEGYICDECKKEEHAHCLHKVNHYSHSAGGTEVHICCHCGTTKYKTYKTKPDPEHGPYSPSFVLVYEEDRKPDLESCTRGSFGEANQR